MQQISSLTHNLGQQLALNFCNRRCHLLNQIRAPRLLNFGLTWTPRPSLGLHLNLAASQSQAKNAVSADTPTPQCVVGVGAPTPSPQRGVGVDAPTPTPHCGMGWGVVVAPTHPTLWVVWWAPPPPHDVGWMWVHPTPPHIVGWRVVAPTPTSVNLAPKLLI